MFDNFEREINPSGRKRLQCNSCKRSTIHLLEVKCKGTWSNNDTQGGSEFSLYRCGACDSVCFEESSWHSEDWDIDEFGNTYYPTRRTQHPPPSSASFTFNTEYTPPELDDLIEEMMYAFAGARLTLATVGMRMVIEFIVKDNSCPGRDLRRKIDALRERQYIDDRQQALLHKIRERGNAGAHSARPMSSKELVAGMGF